MSPFYFIGGLLLAWIYSGATMPATVWVVQATYNRGLKTGVSVSLALSLSQSLWALSATGVLFGVGKLIILLDPVLRVALAVSLVWLSVSVKQAPPLKSLRLQSAAEVGFKQTFLQSLSMPWRWLLWLAIFAAVSVHLRTPGLAAALTASLGSLIGLLLWNSYFALLTFLFGKRVKEEISVRSLNKLRLLSFTVYIGLAVVLLAPMILMV